MRKDEKINTVFIGYDPKEKAACSVLKYLLVENSPKPIDVRFLRKDILELMGMHFRPYEIVNGQYIDKIDQRPFSTEFSFSRFLIPALMMYEGWALYMDCDMYPRTDINELFEEYDNDFYPLYCVKHNYEPSDSHKMDGREQLVYPRKNWSSFVLWNCGHELNRKLTPFEVNNRSGKFLHRFEWLPDKDSAIGSIHEEWNWLDGHSSEDIKPKNVHFTTGGPWFKEWNVKRPIDGMYASEWNADYSFLLMRDNIDAI